MKYNKANVKITDELSLHVKRCLEYNYSTGALSFKDKYSKYSKTKVGDVCGTINSKGSLHFNFAGVDLLVHRVVWFLNYGYWPELFIDHINRNPLDNRLSNLRLADRVQNSVNRKTSGTSKYLGVCYDRKTGKWQASIGTPRKYLGQFKEEKEAAAAYNKEAASLYKEFANLNILEDDR